MGANNEFSISCHVYKNIVTVMLVFLLGLCAFKMAQAGSSCLANEQLDGPIRGLLSLQASLGNGQGATVYSSSRNCFKRLGSFYLLKNLRQSRNMSRCGKTHHQFAGNGEP